MNKADFKERIRLLVKQVYSDKKESDAAAVEYDELTKFPELKAVIVDLLTHEFDSFLASIDWVAPRPTTFRINLRNNNAQAFDTSGQLPAGFRIDRGDGTYEIIQANHGV